MYFAMDMGTSNTRVWLCDHKRIIDFKKAPFGAKMGKMKGKPILFECLRDLIEELLRTNGIPKEQIDCVITSGMSGSEIGLCEIPHITLPADLDAHASRLHEITIPEITDIPFWFVPGLKKICGNHLCDMMRGEETELLGGILPYLRKNQGATVILPGTHNKIIKVNEKGEIVDFQTTLSGELLDMIITNSILAGSVSHDFDCLEAEVLDGAAYAKTNGIHAALFHVRVMQKDGFSSDQLSSFLYGAVLGEDVALIQAYATTGSVWIGGNQKLQTVYHILLRDLSPIPLDRTVADMAVVLGLQEIYSIHRTCTISN